MREQIDTLVGPVIDTPVDIVITVKSLGRAKTRLLGAADRGIGDRAAHEALALALVRDTVAAATATPGVRSVLVVTSDPTVADALATDGVATTPDLPDAGLNAAFAHGAELLLLADPRATVAALQSDLPALRPGHLAAALAEAAGRRAFCADRQGTGTTLLVAAPGGPLDPRFGPGSAAAHAASGAVRIGADLPALRCDVDTAADLALARRMGVGVHTCSVVDLSCVHPA
ncbi:MAG TPA: 2-phospho-L-lactate guanylyltransferase [Pseudonocardiaceae bacterium]|nr:2-phospho-L-lactate guanylyltransferase [Pseudonocardiaceae bacterium]